MIILILVVILTVNIIITISIASEAAWGGGHPAALSEARCLVAVLQVVYSKYSLVCYVIV